MLVLGKHAPGRSHEERNEVRDELWFALGGTVRGPVKGLLRLGAIICTFDR